MPGQGRTIGIILIAVALIACLIATALLLAQVSAKETTVTGAILGILLVAVVFLVLPLGGHRRLSGPAGRVSRRPSPCWPRWRKRKRS